MSNPATHLPEPAQSEAHPAILLADVFAALLAVLAKGWWWRIWPGGREMRAALLAMGQDFIRLMRGLAALPPVPAPQPAPGATADAPASATPGRARVRSAARPARAAAAVSARPVVTLPPSGRRTVSPDFGPPPRAQPFIANAPPRPEPPRPRAALGWPARTHRHPPAACRPR
ncbi:MAG: hypothetical protein NT133_10495 [Alphaproteobacteria bacterium]|nr:hypothetical protein [Alphaproteobacteria bacterium]